MDTNTVRTSTQQMKQSAIQMTNLLQSISSDAQSANWVGPSHDQFISEVQRITQGIKTQIETLSILASRVEHEVTEWENVAASLEGAYGGISEMIRSITLPTSIAAMLGTASGAATSMRGSVLGVSTTADGIALSGAGVLSAPEQKTLYQKMSWSDKFEEQKSINAEINRINGLLPRDAQGKFDELDNQIVDIDKEIVALQEKRDIAEKKSNGLFNQVMPDFPLQGDKEDGLPWRVRADDYEDEVTNYNRQIAALKNQKDGLTSEKQSIQSNLDQLNILNTQEATLDTVIGQGITSDGPTNPTWYKNGFGGCTNYVAEKRDLYISQDTRISGNAQNWRDTATNAGWDVGKQPAKGSIMVFQGEASTDYHTANRAVGGHVAYVENVSSNADGSYNVTISEASTIYDDAGKFVPGTHTKVNTRTVTVPADGHKYVDFIYEKPSQTN